MANALSCLLLLLLAPGPLSYASGQQTIFGSNAVPSRVDSGPDSPVELGVKFKSDVSGTVTGVRFYKARANIGPHSGSLWTSSGILLASATFTGETAVGWQQVEFSDPVVIRPGEIYVASYHTNAGHYSFNSQYFARSGIDNPPLHALSDPVSGGNGVFSYGASSLFPADTRDGANYWVDVLFTPTEISLVSVSPASADIPAGATQRFTALGKLGGGATQDPGGNVVWSSSDPGIATVTAYGLAMGVAGGMATIAARVNGVAATASLTVSAGPGRASSEPLLVVTSARNPFTAYLPEILRAEGLNEFDVLDISHVRSGTLSNYDLVLLGDMALSPSQVTMFTDWVRGGGNLIAMHPDKQLANLLGLEDTGHVLSNAYMRINTATSVGAGLVADPIQFHGSADRYLMKEASALATLYSYPTTGSANPAVTLNTFGQGKAAAFTFDLARSIVYTRQGNPEWSGQSRDSARPIRAYELFYGNAHTGPRTDWVDFGNIAIPQADEQQRLLTNLILRMKASKKPLPRLWYLPRGLKAVVVMTGDDHGASYGSENGATAARFTQYLVQSPQGCNVDNWECVRASAYLLAPSAASNPLRNEQAADAAAKGFEIGVHIDSVPDCRDWNSSSLAGSYQSQLASFAAHYSSVPPPQTIRTHCVSWSDYDSQPLVERRYGIRLDTNYYYYPREWINDRPGLFTGSAMPMRFASRNGTLIDVYQVVTQMTDESGQSYPQTIDSLLDNALSERGYYCQHAC